MATKIVTKNSSTASAVPTASDLVQGELAVNVADKRLFTEDNAGAIVELGTNPTTLNVNGTATMDGLTVDASASGVAKISAADQAYARLTIDNLNGQAWDLLAGTAGASNSGFGIYDGDAGATRLQIDSAGNVGIGTGSPATTLTVTGNGANGIELDRNLAAAAQSARLFFDSSSGGTAIVNYDGDTVFTTGAAAGSASGTERMRIDSAGRVGIGTSSFVNSNAKLVVSNGTVDIEHYTDTHIGYVGTRSNHPFGFLTNGTPKLYITTAGNVGIGTSSPSALVDLGTSTGQKLLMYAASNIKYGMSIETSEYRMFSEDQAALTFGHMARADGTTYTERMRIDSSGNVGIGTSSLTGGNTILNLSRTGSGAGCNMQFANSHNSAFYVGLAGNTSGDAILHSADGTAGMAFGTGNIERMRISSAGNVGIGTSSPVSELDVAGTTPTLTIKDTQNKSWTSADTTLGELAFRTSDTSGIGAHNVAFVRAVNEVASGSTPSGALSFGVAASNANASEAMRIDSAGSTIIKSGNKLILNRTDNAIGGEMNYVAGTGFIFNDANGDGVSFNQGASNKVRIDTSGNLLVGKTANNLTSDGIVLRGGGELFVTRANDVATFNRRVTDGDIIRFAKNAVTVGSVSVSGSTTSYNTSSDQRLKENIIDAPSSSNDIDAIRVRSFDWKIDGSHQKYGMVAQELQSVLPEVVKEGKTDEDMMSVDYSKLVPMLVKEIQSLRNRVAQLEE